MKRLLIIITIFAACARQQSKQIDVVTQDNSGRRVIAWIDPMYAQGPPHLYKSKHPGIAPDCHMDLVPLYADEATAQQAASRPTAIAQMRDLSRTTRTVGRVVMDERRVAQIHAKFDGTIEQLYVNFTGQPVRRGEPLVAIYSPDLLATQNELLLAARNQSDLGRTLVDAARTRLRLWDMSAADIDRVIRSGAPIRDVRLYSPIDGVVVAKNAIAGARVSPADTLYEVADLSRVWVLADVYESELPYVRVGTPAQVTVGGRTFSGRVTFVGPTLTSQTRTASARIELENPQNMLKPDMFADVVLQEPIGNVLTVPDSAVVNTGTRSVVYVARDDGTLEPRDVITGVKTAEAYEIRSGLTAGERVVTDANFLVDSDARLKSALNGASK